MNRENKIKLIKEVLAGASLSEAKEKTGILGLTFWALEIQGKPGFFDPDKIFTCFIQNSVPDQPFAGFDPDVIFGIQIGNQQTSDSQRSTTDIENHVVLSKSGRCQQIKRHC